MGPRPISPVFLGGRPYYRSRLPKSTHAPIGKPRDESSTKKADWETSLFFQNSSKNPRIIGADKDRKTRDEKGVVFSAKKMRYRTNALKALSLSLMNLIFKLVIFSVYSKEHLYIFPRLLQKIYCAHKKRSLKDVACNFPCFKMRVLFPKFFFLRQKRFLGEKTLFCFKRVEGKCAAATISKEDLPPDWTLYRV